MTVAEAAAAYGVSQVSVYRMASAGLIKYRRTRHRVHILGDEALRGTELLHVKQAARRMNLHPQAVYKLCASGALPHRRIGAGRGVIRIKPADVDAYLRQQKH